MMVTLADWKCAAGLDPSAPVTKRRHGDLLEVSWRGPLAGLAGWWWAIVRGDELVRGGWSMGGATDLRMDVARCLDRIHAQQEAHEADSSAS